MKCPAPTEAGHPLLASLYDRLVTWAEHDIASVDFKLPVGDVQHKYTVVHDDGRMWVQRIHITDWDPPMNWTKQDFWRVTEFEDGREVRKLLIEGVLTMQLEECTVTFK